LTKKHLVIYLLLLIRKIVLITTHVSIIANIRPKLVAWTLNRIDVYKFWNVREPYMRPMP